MRFAPPRRLSRARNWPSIRPTIICGAVVLARVSSASRSKRSPTGGVCSAAYSSTWSLTMKAMRPRRLPRAVPVSAAQQHATVVPTEAHRVRERHLDLGLARLVRDVVEVAFRVRVLVVDRRRHLALVDREDAHHGLDRPRGSEAVAHHRFRRRDGELVRVVAEDVLERLRLGEIAE